MSDSSSESEDSQKQYSDTETENSTPLKIILRPSKFSRTNIMAITLSELKTFSDVIPQYEGNIKLLSNFIKTVDEVYATTNTLNLSQIQKTYLFGIVKTKLVHKAAELLSENNFQNWEDLKLYLTTNFTDKLTAETILQDIMYSKFKTNSETTLKYILEKFLQYKSKILITAYSSDQKNAIITEVQKLIVRHFISLLPTSIRGSFIVKNPDTLEQCELLLRNEFNFVNQNPYIYKFHKNYNLLFGMEAFRILDIKLDFKNNNVTINDKNYKLSEKNNAREINAIEIRNSHLNSIEKQKLDQLLKNFEDLFPKDNEPLSHTNILTHKIIMSDETPIYTKNYRLPQIYEKEIESHVNKLLEEKVIQKSHSPWSSPIWIVPKKKNSSNKNKTRMVIDFRKINAKTKDDKFPIPNIDTIFDHIGKSKYFTTLDLHSGFHQIVMNESDREKTAFSTPSGHYEYLRMPFGLKNAPATFQRMINTALGELVNEICVVYLDDIIIFTKNITNIERVFQKLRRANLKIQKDKSEFLQSEFKYLGYIINQNGLNTDGRKIESIKKLNIPKTKKEIKQYLGTLGWYRRFIPNFAKLTKPFTKYLKKDSHVDIYDHEYRAAFENSKKIIAESSLMQIPDFNKEFILTTDASDYAIGAVLTQTHDNQGIPICYASKTSNSAEQNYSTVEKVLKAIVCAIKHCRLYLY